ncbi:hypothetical protein GALL_467090 [mine drainage metagenome]|uniref:Uncharacterized protein n=1 Tax=mine drainage metagenome TaxID=410659 RepID=A0A1J5PLI4_9ZZZZ
MIDQLARRHDQGANAGADQRATQKDQCRGEAPDRKCCADQRRDPAPRKEGGKGPCRGDEATDVVEEAADCNPEWPGSAGDRGKGVRDGFQRRGGGDRELV